MGRNWFWNHTILSYTALGQLPWEPVSSSSLKWYREQKMLLHKSSLLKYSSVKGYSHHSAHLSGTFSWKWIDHSSSLCCSQSRRYNFITNDTELSSLHKRTLPRVPQLMLLHLWSKEETDVTWLLSASTINNIPGMWCSTVVEHLHHRKYKVHRKYTHPFPSRSGSHPSNLVAVNHGTLSLYCLTN